MDTKTRKTEALELLALDKLGYGQMHRLNILTDAQHVIATNGVRAYSGLNYSQSVDACLTLFPDDEYVVFIQRNPNFCICNVRRVDDIETIAGKAEARRIEIALLKTFWSKQPDTRDRTLIGRHEIE